MTPRQQPSQELDLDALWGDGKPSAGEALDLDALWGDGPKAGGVSAGTVLKSAGAALAGGAVGTAGAGLEGLGLVADKIEGYLPEFMQREGSPFRETGRSMQEYAGELGAGARRSVEAEGGATKFLGSTVPEALGSGVAFAGTALGTGLVGGAAAGVGAVALSGVSAGLSQGYNDAKAHGASEDDAWTSALINGGMGATEAIPIGGIVGRLLRRMPRPALEVVKTALLEGAEEASQEAVQGVVGNLAAKYWVGYDEDRKALEGVLEGGGAGAVTGVLMSLLGAGAGRALGPAKAKPGAVPTPAPTSVPTPTGQAPQAAPTGLTQPEQAAESSRPEADPRTESSHALDILSRRVNQSAEELEASTGKPQPRTTVQEAVPATPEEQADIDFAADFGVRAALVRGDRGPLQFPGLHTEGEILLDQAAPSDTRRRMVLLHELGHELARVDPKGFEGLIEAATVLDPEGMADAQQGTARDWEAATGQEYAPEVAREEGMARRIETMGRWLDVQMRHPEHFAEVLLGDKTFMERFRDAVSRLLQRIGFEGLKSSQAVRLEKLVLELGQPTVKNDARSTIALARKVSQAFDILRGREVPPRKPAQQRAQPVPQGEASTPATTLAAPEQALSRAARTRENVGQQEPPQRDERTAKALVELADKDAATLASLLAKNAEEEAATEQRVLSAQGWDAPRIRQYHDLRAKARNRKGNEAQQAARQLANLREQLPPEAVGELMAAPKATGHFTEDLLRAAETRTIIGSEDESVRRATIEPSKKDSAKVAANKAGLRRQIQEGTDRLGTDARFAVAPQDNVGPRGPLFSAVPRHTLFDEFVAYTQQYLRRTQTLAKDAGVKTSIVNAEESRPGITADALRQFERRNIKPIRNILKEYEIENWEAGKYLLALHAPDGNALAAKRSPKKYGKESSPGTGMSNSEAAKIVAEYEADPKRGAGFKQLATINRRVGREKLSLLVSSGLLTQEAADQWRDDLGPNYINLRNSEYDEFEGAFGTSSRTGVRGKESKARQGRADRKSYASILPDTLAAAMEKIDRAAQNEVAKTVGQFVMELNRPEVAEVVAPDMETTDGEQPVARKPHVKPDETLYTYKEKGHEVHVVIRDQDFAEAITKAGVEYWPKWARVGVKAMDMWRKLQTTWNFSWFLSNFPADMQDALITINREGLVKTKRKILKNIGPALQATWASEHDTGKDTKLGKMLREGEEHGAFLGLAEIPTGAELTKRFSKLDSKDPVRAVLGWIEANSSVFEKGVRLAVYTAMRDLKVEPAEAARISRETTTPFVRHGNMTPLLSFLYAFFNARLQGAVIMAKTVSSKRGLKVLGGTMGLAFLVAMINRAIMGEDDEGRDNWDKVPQHRKMNYWALGLPNSETTVGPRMPRQFAWALSAAINLERLMFGSDYKAEDMVKDTLLSVINTASPIDSSGSGWQAITFTLGDPVVQLLENRDFAGNWINPPDFPGDKRPASEKAMRNTPEWSKNAAKLLNWMSGGDEVVEGKVSIRPGTLDHAVKFLIGGAGQEGKRIFELPNKILSGEWTYNDIPIARKLMSGADKHYEQREFFQSVEAVEALTDSVEQYEKLGKKEEAAALRKEHPLEWAMRFRAAVARKKVTRIRDHMDAAGEDEKKKYQDMLDDVMVEYNRAVLAKERR